MWTGLISAQVAYFVAMVTNFLQRSRSTLSSLVQTILMSLLMLYQNTFRKPTSIKLALVCCFCKFTLTRSHKYPNVSRVTLKCSFQIKLSPGLAIKYRSQFCGRGQTQALRLRWAFCWFIWVIIISNNICLFLRLILNSSSITWKW